MLLGALKTEGPPGEEHGRPQANGQQGDATSVPQAQGLDSAWT